ncbi:MAG: hypothetical protein M3N16_00390 [Actinomycetota bacterium]|nr:hypothetical protein [Actinomycetota bacterium]
MSVIGGRALSCQQEIMGVYRAPSLLAWLSSVAGAPVAECPNEVENVIMTRLEGVGDEHGWHLDDYELALISVVTAPPLGRGGVLQLDQPGGVSSVSLAAGDVYLMRTDRVRHRVAPLRGSDERLILNFTYSLEGSSAQPNGSAEFLCT